MTRSRHARRWALALTSAAALVLLPGTALAADSVLWTSSVAGVISSAALDGSESHDLALHPGAPVSVAVDSATGLVYWSDLNLGIYAIHTASLDGGPATQLSTGQATLDFAVGLAIDPAAGRIYWANALADSISFARLDGTGGGDLPTGNATVRQPEGVAIDLAAGRIYWANTTGNSISFAKLDGTGGGDLPTGRATVNGPEGVAIDPSTNRIYWANTGGNRISFASLDPNLPGGADVFTGFKATVDQPRGVAIDPVAGRIYWANSGGQKQISFTSLDDNGDDGDLDVATANAGASPGTAEFPILLVAPRAVAPPAVAGGAGVGSALSCSQGIWAPDVIASFYYRAPQRFAFQWSRDGADVAGATQSTVTASAAGDYRCRVTASNHAGATAQTSDAHHVSGPAVPPPGSPPAFGASTRVTLALVAARVPARGPLTLRIANANAFAIGATVSAQTAKPVAAAHGRRVKLAAKRLTLAAGAKRTIGLSLPASLQQLLAHRHAQSLVLSAIVTDPAGHHRTVGRTVTLRLQVKPARR